MLGRTAIALTSCDKQQLPSASFCAIVAVCLSVKVRSVWEHSCFQSCLQKGSAQVSLSIGWKHVDTASVTHSQFSHYSGCRDIFRCSSFPSALHVIIQSGLRLRSSSHLPQASNNACTVWTVMWEDQKNPLKPRKQISILERAYSYSWLEPGVRYVCTVV